MERQKRISADCFRSGMRYFFPPLLRFVHVSDLDFVLRSVLCVYEDFLSGHMKFFNLVDGIQKPKAVVTLHYLAEGI